MSSSTRLVTVSVLLACVAVTAAIKCWQCGQYSDGVGSITPCNNRSAARLNQCPPDAKYCIVSSITCTFPFNFSSTLRLFEAIERERERERESYWQGHKREEKETVRERAKERERERYYVGEICEKVALIVCQKMHISRKSHVQTDALDRSKNKSLL
ncbi:unnamed protein product, partial [Brenthis ino]